MISVSVLSGNRVWTITNAVADRNWILVDGLDPGVIYEVRVMSKYGEESDGPESGSAIQRIKLGMKRGTVDV